MLTLNPAFPKVYTQVLENSKGLCTGPPILGGNGPRRWISSQNLEKWPKTLDFSPQNWEATSVGGFPDLRKVARAGGANAGYLKEIRLVCTP
jgi:hypothetical protein